MYIPVGFSEAQEQTLLTQVASIAQKQVEIERARKLTVYIGVTGAIIALAKLGVMTIPFIKSRRKRRR